MMCNPTSGTLRHQQAGRQGRRLKGTRRPCRRATSASWMSGAGASDLAKVMGWSTSTFECADVNQSEYRRPEASNSVINEFNTRFDLFRKRRQHRLLRQQLVRAVAQQPQGRGDEPRRALHQEQLRRRERRRQWLGVSAPAHTGRRPAPCCRPGTTPDAMGYPHDLCHAFNDTTGNCMNVARMGTKVSRMSGSAPATGTSTPIGGPITRWNASGSGRPLSDVDEHARSWPFLHCPRASPEPIRPGTRFIAGKWRNAATRLQLPSRGGRADRLGQPVCQAGLPGLNPAGTNPDRRRIPGFGHQLHRASAARSRSTRSTRSTCS